MKLLLSTLFFAGVLTAADPLILGKWKYNPDKSSVKLAPQHVYWTAESGGKIKYGVDLDEATGSKPGAAATLAFDGKEYPQSVNKSFDHVLMKTVTDRDWYFETKQGGKQHSHGVWTVSLDGKMLIHVSQGMNEKTKKEFRNVTVYDKQ